MDEETVKCLLSSIITDYRLLKFKSESDENYSLTFQCKLNGENYDEKCDSFIKNFSNKTSSNWFVRKCIRNGDRYEFRKRYLCQLSSINKVRNKTIGQVRDYNCHASVNIKFLKQSRHTLKKYLMLREGLHVRIDIDHVHSHRLCVAYNLLRCNDDVKTLFEAYFQSGMSAITAKTFHEMELAQEFKAKAVELLTKAHENPTEAQVKYLYKKWRTERYDEKDIGSAFEVLRKNPAMFSEGEVYIKENPTIIVVITPIMRRVYSSGLASEIVFIDSSSLCDQGNTCATFFFAPTKFGAAPVAIAFHMNQSEINYSIAFDAIKEGLEKNGEIEFRPSIIMTDDTITLRNALRVVFPNSKLLLGIFHVTQALWQWLSSNDNHVRREDRKSIMSMFRDIVFSETEDKANDSFANMLAHAAVNSNLKLVKHLKDFWTRREEWAVAFRRSILHKTPNTNNYCDTLKIFKDMVLQRCKILMKMTTGYANFFENCENVEGITQVDEKTFNVRGEEVSEIYVVDKEIGICTCSSVGDDGFCKHLLAVRRKFAVICESTALNSESDREEFAHHALDNEAPMFSFVDINSEQEVLPRQCVTNKVQDINSETLQASSIPIDDQNALDNYNNIINTIDDEFKRIGQVLQNDVNTNNIPRLQKFAAVLETLQTSSEIMSFVSHKTINRKSRKVRIHPINIKRRKNEDISKGQIEIGHSMRLRKRGGKNDNIAFKFRR